MTAKGCKFVTGDLMLVSGPPGEVLGEVLAVTIDQVVTAIRKGGWRV